MKDDRTRDTRDKAGSGLGDMSNTGRGSEQGGSRGRDLDQDIGSGSQGGQGSTRGTGDMGGSRPGDVDRPGTGSTGSTSGRGSSDVTSRNRDNNRK
jgi:hypothetical protein